jgi:two-component system, response regulator
MIDCEILLVEDSPDDAELTMLAFQEGNICNKIALTQDGEEAIDYLFGTGKYEGREENVLPAVILLDLNLPKIGGLDVLRRIRADARTSCLPVVVLTSSKEDEDIVSSYKLGANAYVRKPVDYNRFVEAAKTLGLFWLVINEPPPPGRSHR